MRKYLVFFAVFFIFFGCKYEPRELKVLRGDENAKNALYSSSSAYKEANESQNLAAVLKMNENNKVLKEKEIQSNLEIEKLKASSKVELAKIEAEREKRIKELEAKNALELANINKESLLEEKKLEIKIAEKKYEFLKIAVMVLAGVLFVGLIVAYFINKRNRELKLKLQEEEAKHQKELQMQEHYHQRVTKILDIISTQKLSPESEKEMIAVLRETTKNQNVIIDKSEKENKKLIVKK